MSIESAIEDFILHNKVTTYCGKCRKQAESCYLREDNGALRAVVHCHGDTETHVLGSKLLSDKMVIEAFAQEEEAYIEVGIFALDNMNTVQTRKFFDFIKQNYTFGPERSESSINDVHSVLAAIREMTDHEREVLYIDLKDAYDLSPEGFKRKKVSKKIES